MVAWVQRLDPTADEAQLLAARASHLRRWSIARTSYPEGRAGYLRWRSDLRKQHAAEVTEILTTARSEEHTSELQSLIRNSYAVFCLKKKTTSYTVRHISH